MSELTDILDGSIQLKRFTANLLDKKTAAASMTLDRQPPVSCRVTIDVDGATISTGSIALAGSTNETFSFTENGTKVGTKDFTSVSAITVAGISNGFITIRAVSKTGQPVVQEKEIYSSLAVRFYPLDGKIRMLASGEKKEAKYKFMAAPDKTISENDIIYALSGVAGLTRGQVSFVEHIADFDGVTHHIEAEAFPL